MKIDRLRRLRQQGAKRRYVSKTVHGSKRDADRALAKFVTEVAEGGRVATAPVSVDEVLMRGSPQDRPNSRRLPQTGTGSPSS